MFVLQSGQLILEVAGLVRQSLPFALLEIGFEFIAQSVQLGLVLRVQSVQIGLVRKMHFRADLGLLCDQGLPVILILLQELLLVLQAQIIPEVLFHGQQFISMQFLHLSDLLRVLSFKRLLQSFLS